MRNLVALAMLVAAVASCGKSDSQICDDLCSRTVSCIGGNQQSLADCQAGCTGQDYNKDNCTPQSQQARWACTNQCNGYADCGQWLSCLGGCPKCVKQ